MFFFYFSKSPKIWYKRYTLRLISGVPQGSILATMLNNLHYGKMEKEYFTQFNSPNCLLMRWVDDYILVSTSKHLAERFVLTMHQSMSSFGCHVNRKKTLLNFHQRLFKCDLACVHGNWFPWCGYFINTQTLEFSYNYVQYIGEINHNRSGIVRSF